MSRATAAVLLLCDWVQVGTPPYLWVLRTLLGVARGLNAARNAGVIHFDVKTENVVLNDPVPEWYECPFVAPAFHCGLIAHKLEAWTPPPIASHVLVLMRLPHQLLLQLVGPVRLPPPLPSLP